jgi:metal-sulfur cluster biosynthetic enzyme
VPVRPRVTFVADLTWTDVERALGRVHDPCSLAAGSPVSITDLGLVTGWSADGGTLRVSIAATGPGCTFLGKIADAARAELLVLPGIREVQVELDTELVWEPGRMSPAARAALARRRTALAGQTIPYARRTGPA